MFQILNVCGHRIWFARLQNLMLLPQNLALRPQISPRDSSPRTEYPGGGPPPRRFAQKEIVEYARITHRMGEVPDRLHVSLWQVRLHFVQCKVTARREEGITLFALQTGALSPNTVAALAKDGSATITLRQNDSAKM